jgi:hypothetical protein
MRNRYLVLGLAAVLALALAVPALGGPSNPVASSAASAKQLATKALKKAKKANTAAQTAQSTANSAASSAQSAQNTANGAQNTANGAQTDAAAAQAAADAAQADATAAQNSANAKYDTVTRVESAASATSNADKPVVFATCTGGREATGGGWTTGPAGGAGELDARITFNTAYGNSWGVIARDGGGNASTWNISANVQCIGAN